MTDISIRDVPDDVVSAIDANAQRVGLSRAEYLRRTLERERRAAASDITVESLRRLGETFAHLGDPDVMRLAWS